MAFQKSRGNFGDRGSTRSRDRSSGDRSFGKKPFGKSKGGNFQLHDVTCSQCGKHTQVPFKPTGEKPVLCRECFRGDSPARDFSPRRTGGAPASDETAAQLREINEKLDKIMQHLDLE